MLTAADIMTKDVVSVTPETPVRDIAHLLYTRRISGVPVIDAERRVIGIVSEGDLITHEAVVGEQRRSWWLTLIAEENALARDYAKTRGQRARDAMTADVITVTEDAPVPEIARLLERRRIKRVPVVRDGKLAGIITRGNLLQAMATRDIRQPVSAEDRAIRERLIAELERQSWSRLHTKNIVVENGVVYLWGFVESADERHALHVAAETIPGVKRVEDHLASAALTSSGI
jgi:CBS-domain-containing membrane protein